jgi:hypothetical protein
MKSATKPYDNPRIFWDVDYAKMDVKVKANFIIERVFERGDVEDIRQCRRFYGDERVANALMTTKYLSENTIHLSAAIFNKELNDFRCYIQAQLNQKHWVY